MLRFIGVVILVASISVLAFAQNSTDLLPDSVWQNRIREILLMPNEEAVLKLKSESKDSDQLLKGLLKVVESANDNQEVTIALTGAKIGLEISKNRPVYQVKFLFEIGSTHTRILDQGKKGYEFVYQAKSVFEKQIKGKQKYKLEEDRIYMRLLNELALVEMSFDKLDRSVQYMETIIELLIKNGDPEHKLGAIYNNLVSIYRELDLDKSEYYLEKSKDEMIKHGLFDAHEEASYLVQLSYIYETKKDWVQAHKYYYRTYLMYKELYGETQFNTVLCGIRYARTFMGIEQRDSALYWLNLAMHNNSKKNSFENFANEHEFPESSTANHMWLQHYALNQKAEYLWERYKDGFETEIKDLLLARECFSKCVEHIAYIQRTQSDDNDVKKIKARSYASYARLVQVNSILYKLTGDQQYALEIFRNSSRNKNMLLLSNTQHNSAKSYAGIPLEVLNKEHAIKEEIARYSVDMAQNPDFSDSLFYAKRRLETFIDVLEKTYPKYHDLKYQSVNLDSKVIQTNLANPSDALLDYYVVDTTIFASIFTNRSFDLIEIPYSTKLKEVTRSLPKLIEQQDTSFVRAAYAMYKTFWEPIEMVLKEQSITKVTIIPHADLNSIPFEMLLKELPTEYENYNNHRYLVQEYDINYLFSPSLKKQNDEEKIESKETWLGMAPQFTEKAQDVKRETMQELPGATKEVLDIGEMLGGNYQTAGEATESYFREYASKYQILHLATHAILDNEKPENSRLLFEKDSLNDGVLFLAELYNLEINADLVVLSACNTGKGRYELGEGQMSLARGFAYTGCENIIMSLWPISDHSTSKLMNLFYEMLSNSKERKTNLSALTMAKRTYLEDGGKIGAHPYYWSGVVMIGTDANVDLTESNFNTLNRILLALGFLVLFAILITYGIRRVRTNK